MFFSLNKNLQLYLHSFLTRNSQRQTALSCKQGATLTRSSTYPQFLAELKAEKERVIRFLILSDMASQPHVSTINYDFDFSDISNFEDDEVVGFDSIRDTFNDNRKDPKKLNALFDLEMTSERQAKFINQYNKNCQSKITIETYLKNRSEKFNVILNTLFQDNYYDKTKLAAIIENSVDQYKYLNSSYIDENVKEDMTEENMHAIYFFNTLRAIIATNSHQLLSTILIAQPELINFEFPYTFMLSILINAIHFTRDEMVAVLIKHHVDIEKILPEENQDAPSTNPRALHIAITMIDTEDGNERLRAKNIIEILLANGATPLSIDKINELLPYANTAILTEIDDLMNQYRTTLSNKL